MNQRYPTLFILILMLITPAACQDGEETVSPSPATALAQIPTAADPIATLEPEVAETAQAGLPPTWTPDPFQFQTATPVGDFNPTAIPSFTPFPTLSPTPTETNTPTATATPFATSISIIPVGGVTPSAPIDAGANLLNNPSFEGGWYHQDGDPELQIPNEWRFQFIEGENNLDADPWNKWVRPEVRVLPKEFLPASEHDLFIWDGDQTLKIFKGQGAINIELLTTQNLPAGAYQFTVYAYPDLVVEYSESGGKVFADEKEAGEVRFLIDGRSSGWFYPTIGTKNRLSYSFVIDEEHPVTLGIGIRGRWAILNNGWFLDDWVLQKID